jgi:TRAP-type transport system small permease protein
MRALVRVCDVIEKVLNAVIIVLLMSMTVVIFYQVVLRYAFQSSNIWAEEFARYAFIWVVLLGSASAIRRYQHIRIDFAFNAMPPALQRWVDILNYVLIAGFLVVLTYYGWQISMRTGNQISAGLHVPMSVMYMSIPISAAIMLLFTAQIVLRDFVFCDAGARAGRAGE